MFGDFNILSMVGYCLYGTLQFVAIKMLFSCLDLTRNQQEITSHAWSLDHADDLNNASIIDKGGFRIRKTLKACHTKLTPNANNNSCAPSGQSNILFNKYIHNYLHFYYFAILRIFIQPFSSSSLLVILILPFEDCGSGSRKLVIVSARDRF